MAPRVWNLLSLAESFRELTSCEHTEIFWCPALLLCSFNCYPAIGNGKRLRLASTQVALACRDRMSTLSDSHSAPVWMQPHDDEARVGNIGQEVSFAAGRSSVRSEEEF